MSIAHEMVTRPLPRFMRLCGHAAIAPADPRITGRELRAQGLLLAGYAAVAAGIGWLTLSRIDDRAWLAGGGLAFALWLAVALPLLARHLARRLDKPGR